MSVPESIPAKRPWERREGENDKAWEAFCQYLQLPKRGESKRRFTEDLAKLRGCVGQNVTRWLKGWEWEKRAAAYDRFLALDTLTTAELADRRNFMAELRKLGKELRDKGMKLLDDPEVDITGADAIRMVKLGVDLEAKADSLGKPDEQKYREQLAAGIRGLLEGAFTRELGGVAGRPIRGTLTATERTARFDLDGDPGDREVCEIQELPGEVCEGGSEPELVV